MLYSVYLGRGDLSCTFFVCLSGEYEMAKKVITLKGPDEQLPHQLPTRVDEQLLEPGEYEITDSEDFTIELPLIKKDKRWAIAFDCPPEKIHKVVFKMWSYECGIDLRKKATQYDDLKRVHFIDHDLLNRLKMQKLIKSWTFEHENSRLKLFHINDVLTDESFKAIMSLHPNILKYIVEKMNEVLEFNG